MEHKDIIEKGIIEDYLLHRLTESETNDFEEHLLYCKECREQLKETEESIKLIQYMAIHFPPEIDAEFNQNQGQTFLLGWRKIAATVFLFVCAAIGVIYLIQKPSIHMSKNEEKSKNVNIISDSVHHDNGVKLENQPQPSAPSRSKLVAGNYLELPVYENAIKNNLRGENVGVLSPKISQNFSSGEKVIFILKDTVNEISLSVINNSGVTVFENRVKMPFTLTLKLEKGLYYWEIIENDEVVFVSKFLIL
jgi:hypothetical protein